MNCQNKVLVQTLRNMYDPLIQVYLGWNETFKLNWLFAIVKFLTQVWQCLRLIIYIKPNATTDAYALNSAQLKVQLTKMTLSQLQIMALSTRNHLDISNEIAMWKINGSNHLALLILCNLLLIMRTVEKASESGSEFTTLNQRKL